MLRDISFDQARAAALRYLDCIPAMISPGSARNFAVILALILLFGAYYLLPGLKVFGLDEVHYYDSFKFKLREEGRWINFLLHHWLRQIPLVTHSLLFLLCSWMILFRIADNLIQEARYAAVIASVLLMAPPFVQQSLWPATHLPTVITLLILIWLVRKGFSHRTIYLLGGVLLFGAMQNYYFMLPLFFIGEIASENRRSGKVRSYLLSHLFYWILGAMIGFLFALVAVFVLTGQIGIVPAEWRRIMPASDFQSLVRNIIFIIESFREQAFLLFKSSTNNNPIYIVSLLLLFVFRFEFWRSGLPGILILLAVGISFFVFSIPLAPIIETRSLVALSSAIIILLLVSNQSNRKTYWPSIILLLWTGWNLSINAHSYLNIHKSRTEFVLQKIVTVLPQHPSNYNALAIFGKVDHKLNEAILFNNGPFTRPIVLASGFNDFLDCRVDRKECHTLALKFDLLSKATDQPIKFIGVSDNIAVIVLGGV